MSESIRRKNSSRQLLQNLIRVTAQRSQEDAEEVERERRRRSREKERGDGSPPQHNNLAHNTELDEDLKPSGRLVLEEDEGFSDWSHRLESRNEPEVPEDCGARMQRALTLQWKPEPDEDKQREDEEEEEGKRCEPEGGSSRLPQKMSSSRKEARTSFSSTVFLPQDARLQHAMGQPADRTSYLVAGTMRPRGGSCRVEEQEDEEETKDALQTEWRSAETRQIPREGEEEEEEELSFTREEKEEEKEISEQRSVEHRRSEEVDRGSAACLSSVDEESMTCYGPMSPTFKKLLIQFYPDEANSRVSPDGKCTIIERTESLRKSTNIKKTLLPVAVSKIDKKLEQYTHALELSSKEGRSGSQMLMDLTSTAEHVSSKKNLFEAGEAWNQNAISVAPSKDADGLKVGVADLINQWVRGSEDGSRCSSPFKPADSSSSKRYKFVVTGHGKYEKVSVDGGCEDANCQSAGQFHEDL